MSIGVILSLPFKRAFLILPSFSPALQAPKPLQRPYFAPLTSTRGSHKASFRGSRKASSGPLLLPPVPARLPYRKGNETGPRLSLPIQTENATTHRKDANDVKSIRE